MPITGTTVNDFQIDFERLTRPNSPNYYLACASDRCNIKGDIVVPVFPLSVGMLKDTLNTIIKRQARYKLIDSNVHLMQYQYIQKSFVFGFEDYITLRFHTVNNKQSTLSLLSFSKTGYYDFGVNKRRVKRLLSLLQNQF